MVKLLFIDPTKKVIDLDGEAVKQRTSKGKSNEKCDKCGQFKDDIEEKDLTVGVAVVNSLNGIFENSNKLSFEEKLDRFKLATKIHGAGLPVEIENKEKTLIMKLVAEAYASPMIVARVHEAINEVEKERKND